ncbi:MFS transporter [Noviherbaspirillum pedocola]|uniref:MFS transporter n=1 Tax=Noviherbaspirillum pedocola TaxID=2801341 RepID=A0A934SXJ3_9BURK|nr:MFS transporter [Noviherbaspirillum pedocola]MBK4738676.1 MFS transporter [Noviherbaspirillum pedocola]
MRDDSIRVTDIIESRKVSAYQYIIVLLCGLLLFIDGFDTQAISYIVPQLAKEWHISTKMLGPIFSSTLVGLTVGYLFVSPLSDKYGHKRVMIIATFLFGVFTIGTTWASNVQEMLALRFITGVGLGAAAPSAVALTGEYSPQRLRATFVLAIYCGFSFGFVVAGFAAGYLLPRYGWTSLLWVGGMTPILLSVALFLALPESITYLARRKSDFSMLSTIVRRINPDIHIRPGTHFLDVQSDARRAPITSLFTMGRACGTLLLWLVFFINLGVFYFMQSWLPTILTGLKYPMDTVVWLTSLPTIGGILAALVVGPAMDRIGPYVSIGTLYLCGGFFMAFTAIMFTAKLPVLMVAIFLAGFCVSGGQKSVIALSALFYPTEIRSTGVGWALGIGRFGGIAGPSVVGLLIAAHWTPTQIFMGSGALIFVAGIVLLLMGALYRESKNASHETSSVKPVAEKGLRNSN